MAAQQGRIAEKRLSPEQKQTLHQVQPKLWTTSAHWLNLDTSKQQIWTMKQDLTCRCFSTVSRVRRKPSKYNNLPQTCPAQNTDLQDYRFPDVCDVIFFFLLYTVKMWMHSTSVNTTEGNFIQTPLICQKLQTFMSKHNTHFTNVNELWNASRLDKSRRKTAHEIIFFVSLIFKQHF